MLFRSIEVEVQGYNLRKLRLIVDDLRKRMEEIPDLIEEGRSHYGSQTFDQHLMELVKSSQVEFEVAKSAANNPSDFDLKMNMFGSATGGAAAGGGPHGTQGLADEMTNIMGG